VSPASPKRPGSPTNQRGTIRRTAIDPVTLRMTGGCTAGCTGVAGSDTMS